MDSYERRRTEPNYNAPPPVDFATMTPAGSTAPAQQPPRYYENSFNTDNNSLYPPPYTGRHNSYGSHSNSPYAAADDQSHSQTPSPYNDSQRNPFDDELGYPLQTRNSNVKLQPQLYSQPVANDSAQPLREGYEPDSQWEGQPANTVRKRGRFWQGKIPWFIYTLTVIQISVFIGGLAKNGSLTGSPIEVHPQFNPMIGPSPYVLINMGARYVPCMRNQAGVQNAAEELLFPCPNTTTSTASCSLSDLCGFSGVPPLHLDGSLDQKPAPNQWWRFIVPIFLHAGIIHIGFNMLLQILLGADLERAIGPIRVALVYFPSGIFGFIMGANFAPAGISSTGASGALFGLIALLLLDLFYTWSERPSPWRDLLILVIDSVLSFVLGLLPGVDNFSHIGGFIMGLVIGLCLFRSPNFLRRRLGDDTVPAPSRRTRKEYKMVYSDMSSSTAFFNSPRMFFVGRKPLWWVWWLVRLGALVAAVVLFAVLLNSFYSHHDTTCSWCKYLSCLPVKNWCDIGDLTFTQQNTTTSANPAALLF